MSVAVLVMTDGRVEYLRETLASLHDQLRGPVTRWIVHDDTGDDAYHQLLRRHLPAAWELVTTSQRCGFGGAYRHAYDWLLAHTDEPYVFSTEDDFVVTRPVNLTAMQHVLDYHRNLAQMALRRQPWNDAEKAAGGIVEQHPNQYVDCGDDNGNQWLQHRQFWTTNPSLIPRRILTQHPWPTVPHSEGVFSADVFTDRYRCCAFWGSRESGEWVRHIGAERRGRGY